MKIISYNVRGLGGVEKRNEVHRLVLGKRLFVMCLKETKFTTVNDFFG